MIMSQTVDVNTEPRRWPIAPDGYIPNSVIRNWMVGWRRKEDLTKTEFCCDDIFNSLHLVDECSDEEDLSTRVFWFIQDEEDDEDEEKIDDVKWKKKEKKVEKNEKVGGEERADEKKEKEEVNMDRVVLLRQSNDIQPTTTLLDQPKTSDVEPQRQEVVSTYTSRKTVNFLPTSCQENGSKQLREQREDMKLPETITPTLQYLPVSNNQRTSSFIPKACPEPPVESPVVSVVSADVFIPKKEPRMTLYIPPIEPENLTPQPPKPPSPAPEDSQPQPDFGSPECLPIRDKISLLSSTKFHSLRDQAQVLLDQKVLDFYKKSKVVTKNSSLLGKRSTIIERPPAFKTKHSTLQTSTRGLNLNNGLCSPPELRSMLSKPTRIVDPECPRPPLCPAQVAEAILPTSDQKGYKSMPEWRKNLYKLIARRGFCSPRAAKLATRDQPVKSSIARQFAPTIPSLQPGQAAAHQRVVQKIQTKDALEPASSHFHHGIPMSSQQSFCTSNPCGKTQYGRLQFDWMRGYDEDSVCG